MRNISYGSLDLNDGTIVTTDIQHEDIANKSINIQRYAYREGGRVAQPDFDVKKIKITGFIKAASATALETAVDQMNKVINIPEQDLDIEYAGGTRRYVCSLSKKTMPRNFWNVDYIQWELEFTVSDPPFGKNIDTSTLELAAISASNPSTATMEYVKMPTFSGSYKPYPIIRATFTSVNGVQRIDLINTNSDGHLTLTTIQDYKFYDGDVLELDLNAGTVRVNGADIEFTNGFLDFSLDDNEFEVIVIGKAYNIDIKFVYYPLWL